MYDLGHAKIGQAVERSHSGIESCRHRGHADSYVAAKNEIAYEFGIAIFDLELDKRGP